MSLVNLDSLRAYARRLRLQPAHSTVKIERPTSTSYADDGTYAGATTYSTVAESTEAYIRMQGTSEDVEAGGGAVTVDEIVLEVDIDLVVRPDDRITVLTSRDTGLVGTACIVEDVGEGDNASTRVVKARAERKEFDP